MALQKGLVGHWSMDQEDTDNGKIRDRSAYDNHGTLNGGVSNGGYAPSGSALDFNGGYVQVPTSIDQDNTNKNYTVSAWFNSNDVTQNRQGIIGQDNGGYDFFVQLSRDNNGELMIATGSDTQIKPGSSISSNEWNHITVLLNGSNILYSLNGETIQDTGVDRSNYGSGQESALAIGSISFDSGEDFNGKISDVRVYNRALSQSEINLLYNKRTTVGGAVQGITAEVYDTQSYYNSNSHANNKSELDQFFDTTNSGVALEKARVHNRPHIFFGNSNQNAGIGNVNNYPYYITTGDKDGYAWKIESSFVAPETGTYTFGVDSDDASDVLIDGSVVASYYGVHGFSGGVSNHTGTVSLTQGNQYDFAARFEEGGGGDGIAVAWQKPSDSSLSKFPLDILTPIQT